MHSLQNLITVIFLPLASFFTTQPLPLVNHFYYSTFASSEIFLVWTDFDVYGLRMIFFFFFKANFA